MKYSDLIYYYIPNTPIKLIRHAKEIDNITNNQHFEKINEIIISDNDSSDNILSDDKHLTLFKFYAESGIKHPNTIRQNGGKLKNINVDEKEYFINTFKEKINDPDDLFLVPRPELITSTNKYTAIFAMPLETSDNNLLQKTPQNMCFSMVYRDKNKLEIKGIQVSTGCVIKKNTQGKFKDANKQGTIILKHIIKYAKENNFKSIELTDGSTYSCTNSMFKKSYNIPRIHTLCYLEPWYYKHGFRYVQDENNLNVENNKIILNDLKTSDLKFDILMNIIYSKLILELFDSIKSIDLLNMLKNIQSIYSDKYKENICEFFKQLTYSHCDIMAMIDENIFKSLGLKLSEAESDNLMILKLN